MRVEDTPCRQRVSFGARCDHIGFAEGSEGWLVRVAAARACRGRVRPPSVAILGAHSAARSIKRWARALPPTCLSYILPSGGAQAIRRVLNAQSGVALWRGVV